MSGPEAGRAVEFLGYGSAVVTVCLAASPNHGVTVIVKEPVGMGKPNAPRVMVIWQLSPTASGSVRHRFGESAFCEARY